MPPSEIVSTKGKFKISLIGSRGRFTNKLFPVVNLILTFDDVLGVALLIDVRKSGFLVTGIFLGRGFLS